MAAAHDRGPGALSGLAPVRAALLSQARTDADRLTGEAERAVAEGLRVAQEEARQIRDAAHAEALDQARNLSAAEESHGRRKAREVELTARRAAYDALVEESRTAVRRLLDEPEVLERVAALARAREGADAEVTRTDDGVVVGEGTRRVEFSLVELADRAVAELERAREQT